MSADLENSTLQVEQQLLACILGDRRTWPLVADSIQADDFLDPVHRRVLEVIEDASAQGHAVDIVTIAPYLGALDMGPGNDPDQVPGGSGR